MGKKTARGRGHQGGRKPPKGARRFKGGRVAPRAEQLHFPDDVQAVVCELLCDLRLPTTTDTLARRKLEKYKKEPRKVLKALEARRRGATRRCARECWGSARRRAFESALDRSRHR